MLQNVWMEQHVLFSPIALSIPSPVSCQKIDSTSSTLFFFLFLRVLTWINHHILRKNWRISQVLHNNWSCFWVRKFPFSIFRSWIFKKREILQGRAFWINTVRYRPIETLQKNSFASSRTTWIVILIYFWYSLCVCLGSTNTEWTFVERMESMKIIEPRKLFQSTSINVAES